MQKPGPAAQVVAQLISLSAEARDKQCIRQVTPKICFALTGLRSFSYYFQGRVAPGYYISRLQRAEINDYES
jgi:hypothetical protein